MEGFQGYEGGAGIAQRERGASESMAAAEHIFNGDRRSVSAVYGRYLPTTGAAAPGYHRVAEVQAITRSCFGEDFLLRHEHAGSEAEEVLGLGAAASRNSVEQVLGKEVCLPDVTAHGGARAAEVEAGVGDNGLIFRVEQEAEAFGGEVGTGPPPRAGHGEEKPCVGVTMPQRSGQGAEDPCDGITTAPGADHGDSVTAAQGEADAECCNTAVEPEAEVTGTADSGGGMRAPLDIFLARERTEGVAPSWLDTARILGFSYWIGSLKEWIFRRLGFGSRMPTIPRAWSWMSLMLSPPVYQTAGHDGRGGSCVICASVMCIHAQHRLAFERLHGPGSFPYVLADIDYLKSASESAGVWSPATGSYPADMLDFVSRAFPGGLTCGDVPGWRTCSLPFKQHRTFPRKELEPIAAMFMIRYWGPMIGTMYAGDMYIKGIWNPNYIYRGEGRPANHAVLCVDYRVTKKCELLIRILDNQREDGPLCWVSYRAFTEFTWVQVEAMSMDELRIEPRSLLQRLLSWVIPRI